MQVTGFFYVILQLKKFKMKKMNYRKPQIRVIEISNECEILEGSNNAKREIIDTVSPSEYNSSNDGQALSKRRTISFWE
jgi:uncharacterized membrane protein YobD (UPF0266 family)